MTVPLRHAAGFHHGADIALRRLHGGNPDHFVYTFENFSHPFVEALISKLNRSSVAGMLDPKFLETLEDKVYFNRDYPQPAGGAVEVHSHPHAIDVAPGGAYSQYNWELFYHIPVAVAVHHSKNRRYAEAQRWFHYVFDPTCTDPAPAPQRWWKFLAFRHADMTGIEALLELLGTPDDELSGRDIARKEWVHNSYAAILSNPFDPHAVARARPLAYQYYVVMQYLSNLIAWGDSLFQQYTIETINEASMHYVLAANILRYRPEKVPAHGPNANTPKNFYQLKNASRDMMGSTLVELETQLPFNSTLPPAHKEGQDGRNGALYGIGESLYFCVPRNETLLRYWDTVADRLFKIRHCMDITGVVRPLALWAPPLDPGMLIKARAAGLDIGSIVSGLNQPVGPLRSLPLMQKALELCGELKALGGAFLSACEKGDAEQLALMRQRHEIRLEEMTQDVRFLQWKQAQEATQSLLRTRATTLERYKYYLRLLGQTPDSNAVPDTISPDRRKLTEDNFDDAYSALVGEYDKPITLQAYPNIKWPDGASPSVQAGSRDGEQLHLSDKENSEIDTLNQANIITAAGTALQATASAVRPIPGMDGRLHFWGLGASMHIFGGEVLSEVIGIGATLLHGTAVFMQGTAGMTAKMASYERRAADWCLQANLAAHELMQMGRQIISSLIAEQVAEHEYESAKTQVKHSQEIDQYLHSKFTNAELYGWMQGDIADVYYKFYRFAFETACRAEQTMKRELMRPELDATDFVQFNYWDTGRKGLLSGEKLFFDLKRMEMAYHDNNKRELELTRHVSLRQLDPHALLLLRTTGECTVSIPEWLYDLDCPGHYMRRIKTVAVSLPSTVGPYTSVNCALTLQRSTIRVSSLAASGYARDTDNDDDRFVDYLGSTDAIVTSGGTNDAGMFETNLHEERFLPFEGAGAVGTWHLALPSQIRTFDYMTISDAIVHIRYTARQGGAHLGALATKELAQALSDAGSSPLLLLLTLRHDFPTEWAAFTSGKGDLSIPIRKNLFPYLAQTGPVTIDGLTLFAPQKDKLSQLTAAVPDGLSDGINGPTGTSTLTLPTDGKVLTRSANAQLFFVVQYHLGS